MKFYSYSPEDTISLGQRLGQLLKPGSVVCLEGNLGAGKTHFAKGVALGLGVGEHVTSPTFTIINEYEGIMPLFHVDAYRLESEDEAYELGLEEYLYGTGATLVEWPERISELLPDEYMTVVIRFAGADDRTRELEITPVGSRYEKIVEELKAGVCSGD